MLTSGMGMVRSNPDIEQAVKEMLTADANFDRNENRSVHRQHLVRHIRLQIRQPEQLIEAFSRNISVVGIGIITDQVITVGTTGEMEIGRLKGPAVKIIVESRWCRNYGENWFFSGWQFQSLKR